MEGDNVKTYVFHVELEPDDEGWRAFYPPLEGIGASTWGYTQEEALKNISEVLEMLLEGLEERGQSLSDVAEFPASPSALVEISR